MRKIPPFKRRSAVHLLLGAAQLAFASCQFNYAKAADSGDPYQTIAPDIQVDLFNRDVMWLDDQTLAFIGVPLKQQSPLDLAGSREKTIYLWKIGRQPVPYKTEWPGRSLTAPFFCAGNGELIYAMGEARMSDDRRSWAVQVMRGAPGKEEPANFQGATSADPRWSRMESSQVARRRCDQLFVPTLDYQRWAPSYRRTFVVGFGTLRRPLGSGFDPYPSPTIRQQPAGNVITVSGPSIANGDPLTENDVEPSCTQSPSWEEVVIAWGCPSDERDMNLGSVTIWKIRPDGKTEATRFDTRNMWNLDLIPFRDGYYVHSSDVKNGTREEMEAASGLYLVRNSGLTKILSGYYIPSAVSPNGCLGAFARSDIHDGHLTPASVAVVDLCRAAPK